MDQKHLSMVSDEPTKAIAGYHLVNDLDRGNKDFHDFVQNKENAQMWHEYFVKCYREHQINTTTANPLSGDIKSTPDQ